MASSASEGGVRVGAGSYPGLKGALGGVAGEQAINQTLCECAIFVDRLATASDYGCVLLAAWRIASSSLETPMEWYFL
jgi:hypothetical protein